MSDQTCLQCGVVLGSSAKHTCDRATRLEFLWVREGDANARLPYFNVATLIAGTDPPEPEPDESPLRAFYKRLAAAYESTPTVPDRGGGLPGDRFPL